MKQTYEVRAIRSGRWWALETPQIPRARSQARRLDQAEPMIREAIAMVLDIDPDSFDVQIHPILDPNLDHLVSAAAHARDTATTARANATDALRQLVETASSEGYTVRDIAEIAGVSHQYAAKLTSR
jgi:predicted RNase H-like HicB family nuclease